MGAAWSHEEMERKRREKEELYDPTAHIERPWEHKGADEQPAAEPVAVGA